MADVNTGTGSLADAASGSSLADAAPTNKASSGRLNRGDIVSQIQGSINKENAAIDDELAGVKALKVPQRPELPQAPKQSDYSTDPMQTFGSSAMWLAMFGSLLTKTPLVTALKSATALNNAANQKDATAFKNAFDKWKIDSDYALKLSQYDMESYKAAVQKGEVAIRAHAAANKNETAMLALEARMSDHDAKMAEKQVKNMSYLNEAYGRLSNIANTAAEKAKEEGVSDDVADQVWFNAFANGKNKLGSHIKSKGTLDSFDQGAIEMPEYGFALRPGNAERIKKTADEDAKYFSAVAHAMPIAQNIEEELLAIHEASKNLATGGLGERRDSATRIMSYLKDTPIGGLLPGDAEKLQKAADQYNIIDKSSNNLALDSTNLRTALGGHANRGSVLQLQTTLNGKPGNQNTPAANANIAAGMLADTKNWQLHAEIGQRYAQANPLGIDDFNSTLILEALKQKYPLVTHNGVIAEYHKENAEKIREHIDDAIAHPDKYGIYTGKKAKSKSYTPPKTPVGASPNQQILDVFTADADKQQQKVTPTITTELKATHKYNPQTGSIEEIQ